MSGPTESIRLSDNPRMMEFFDKLPDGEKKCYAKGCNKWAEYYNEYEFEYSDTDEPPEIEEHPGKVFEKTTTTEEVACYLCAEHKDIDDSGIERFREA